MTNFPRAAAVTQSERRARAEHGRRSPTTRFEADQQRPEEEESADLSFYFGSRREKSGENAWPACRSRAAQPFIGER